MSLKSKLLPKHISTHNTSTASRTQNKTPVAPLPTEQPKSKDSHKVRGRLCQPLYDYCKNYKDQLKDHPIVKDYLNDHPVTSKSLHFLHESYKNHLKDHLASNKNPHEAKTETASPPIIENITKLHSVEVSKIVAPTSVEEIQHAVKNWDGKIAIGGGRYSMGGQVAVPDGLHLDMRGMNKLISLNTEKRTVRVQAGMTWRDLQEILDPHDLAVQTMQSYANFTVGGSVGVNAHGRYVNHGPVGQSVRSLELVLADGTVKKVSREENPELFKAAIGGYGAVGIITAVELNLDVNEKMERVVHKPTLAQYKDFFFKEIAPEEKGNIMHNADLLPPNFDKPVSITWKRSTKPLTVEEKLVKPDQSYRVDHMMQRLMAEVPKGGKKLSKGVNKLRKSIQKSTLSKPAVVWRNFEASYNVDSLDKARKSSTYALQEYFIPTDNFEKFAEDIGQILRENKVNALNVSIRHASQDNDSMLPWAKKEVFAFVLYYNQDTDQAAQDQVGEWSRKLIDSALDNGGRYYLPYQPHATQDQFERAYPEFKELKKIKAEVDPNNKFSNALLDQYLLSPEKTH